ncbi:MAG: radical SAM protein [Magnetococcales bacterium]|nr:radical SAM protein [Magnetococcales bacterium]
MTPDAPLPPPVADAEASQTPSRSGRIAPHFEAFQNPVKIFHHGERLLELATTGDARPLHLTLGLTNYCNHKCPWCYINWHQAGRGPARPGEAPAPLRKPINADERVIEAVGEARAMGLKALTIVGDGEPLLHPRIVEILRQLAGFGLDVGIFTNLGIPRPEILEALVESCFFVRGSLDAARPETHQRLHGCDDFALVVDNLRRLVRLRGSKPFPILGVQYVANQWNVADLPFAAAFFRDLGLDYLSIKPAYRNVLNPDHPENTLALAEAFPLMEQARAMATDHFAVYAKFPQFAEVLEHRTNDGRYYQRCLATPLSPYLDEDGAVEMCGNLKGRGFTLGNVHEASFGEIWSSPRRRERLARIDLHQCPAGCRLDPLNKVLWDAFYPERRVIHPNFV